MRPDDVELDDEIRGHMAISIKERIERGEDPEAARLAALREFGNVTLTRDSMRAVWRPGWFEMAEGFWHDTRIALRSLNRARGLATTVVVTLALGIGANAAIFSVVRAVLLRPLVNRDEDRLIYIRQSAPGIGQENTTFSVPEINDFKSRVSTIGAFGDFSTVDFRLIGLGREPRMVKAGVVSGSFFDVMGLRPVLGRLLNSQDDGPDAAGAAVLTYRFGTISLDSDPTVVGKTIRLGSRNATVVGVLEPSVPYPADTEIIANVVTSPHHFEATMVTSRPHRMTELFGRLAPGVSLDEARAELIAVHAAMVREHPDAYSSKAAVQLKVGTLRDQIAAPARTILIVLLAAAGFLAWAAYFTGNQIAAQAAEMPALIDRQVQALLGWARGHGFDVDAGDLDGVMRQLATGVGPVTRALGGLLGGFATLFLLAVLGIYVAVEPKLYERGIAWMLPADERPYLAETVGRMAFALRRLLAGRLLGMFIEGVATGVALSLYGVPMAALLGLLTGLLAFLPNIGAPISGALMILVGFSGGTDMGLFCIAVYITVQTLDSNVIIPMVAKKTVDLAPALVLGAQLVFGVMFGILGLALADPLVAMVKILLERRSERNTEAAAAAVATG